MMYPLEASEVRHDELHMTCAWHVCGQDNEASGYIHWILEAPR